MNWRDLTHEERVALLRQAAAAGKSIPQVAADVGAANSTVDYWVKQHCRDLRDAFLVNARERSREGALQSRPNRRRPAPRPAWVAEKPICDWRSLSHAERLAFIRQGYADGRSTRRIGEMAGVSEGVIRHFRDDWAPGLRRAPRGEKVKPVVGGLQEDSEDLVVSLGAAKARAVRADARFEALMQEHYPGKRYGTGSARVAA